MTASFLPLLAEASNSTLSAFLSLLELANSGALASAESSGLYYAFEQSGSSGKIIVALLVVINLFSFSVFFTKFWNLSDARRQNDEFLDAYNESEQLLEIFEQNEHFRGSPLWNLYYNASLELKKTLSTNANRVQKITQSQMRSVSASVERAYSENILHLESKMSILASAVSGAPFLGLLGTVWGVMNTFGAIATTEGGADLQDMAPGVSSALLTTVTALIVALLAMFGYNYLVNSIRAHIAHMDIFRAEMASVIERHYVHHQQDSGYPQATTEQAGSEGAGAPGEQLRASTQTVHWQQKGENSAELRAERQPQGHSQRRREDFAHTDSEQLEEEDEASQAPHSTMKELIQALAKLSGKSSSPPVQLPEPQGEARSRGIHHSE